MEFEATVVKCPKCSESLSLFFQKGAQGSSDVELRGKINEVIKSMAKIVGESEDVQARLARIEDFLQSGPEQSQEQMPQPPLPPSRMR